MNFKYLANIHCVGFLIFLFLDVSQGKNNIEETKNLVSKEGFRSKPFKFVLSHYEPMVICSLNDHNLNNYKGASVALLQ